MSLCLLALSFALAFACFVQHSREQARQDEKHDWEWYNLFLHIRAISDDEPLTSKQIKELGSDIRFTPPSARTTSQKIKRYLLLATLALAIVATIASFSNDSFKNGQANALRNFSPAAFYRGAETPEEMQDFFSERTNFCEICNRCRYEDDGDFVFEIEGHSRILGGTEVWICDKCFRSNSFSVCVDGEVYTFYAVD